MSYHYLIDTYATEREKVLGVWSMFQDEDLESRSHPIDKRGRSVREQMIHQCISENLWFINMLKIDVQAPPLPEEETRLGFIKRYAEDSGKRLEALNDKGADWWETELDFFDVKRSRAWVFVRRLVHTSHHRGQQTAYLRMLGREVHSTYEPSADTGGLMQNKAPTIYPHPDIDTLIEREEAGLPKSPLPDAADAPVTERPDLA